jgi:cobalt/nickel transport system permease protein
MHGSLLSVTASRDWLSRLDPRVRLIAAFGFALVILSIDSLSLLAATLIIAISFALAAGLKLALIAKRLIALEVFMLVLCILLPLTVPGERWFALGPISLSWDGLRLALSILLKANSIVMMLLTLVGTLEPVVLGQALARLKVPEKLVHLFLFTVRYLAVLGDEYRRLRRAMLARGFKAQSDRHSWRSLGWLIGMLLVRSLGRAERVLAAMKCRGFHGRFYLLADQRWAWRDTGFGLVSVVVMGFLLALNGGIL